MYEYLHGRVEDLGPGTAVLDVQGVGYAIQVSGPCAASLTLGEDCRLLVHFSVSENAQSLFGFKNAAERTLFRRLLQVNGIGPSSALNLLSSLPPDEMVRAILDGDQKRLVAMKGVGKKTAERLIVELRDHLQELLPGSAATAVGGSSPIETTVHSVHADLERVLAELGTAPAAAASGAQAALDSLGPDAEFQELLRYALTPKT
ncbi:MAG: Holliday junction branch migration protein RuvA [Planctomycetota bacterium]